MGHVWIAVDIYDEKGNVIGRKELHFCPEGYVICDEGDCYPSWVYSSDWESNQKQDENLLQRWKDLEDERKAANGDMDWAPWRNCWGPADKWRDYGGLLEPKAERKNYFWR